MAEPAATINLVDEATGEVVNVDEADLPKIGAGYRPASAEEVAADLQRQQYGEGFGNEAAAFGEGILSGATIGLSDVAAKAIAPEYAEGLAARREYNPTAAGVGEGVGVLGATLLSGGAAGAAGAGARGAGLAARGARVLSAPARALVGLGEAATAGTGRLLGAEAATGVLGGALREAAAMGVGGAAEGALFGAAKAVTDDYLNDHEITAERIAMGAGDGMWMGGGLGAGLGLAGGVLGRGAKKVRDAFTRSDADRDATRVLEEAVDATPGATGEAATGATAGSGAATNAEAEAAGATLSADQRILQQIGYKSDDNLMAELVIPTNPELATARTRVRNIAEKDPARGFGQLKQDRATDIVRDIEEFRRIEDQLETYINKGHKKDAVKAAIEAAPPDWSDAHFDRVLSAVDESRSRLSKMREDTYALDQTQHAAIKDAVDMANELEARLKGFTGRKVQPQQGPLAPNAPAVRYDAEAVAEIQDLHDKFKGALGRAQRKAGNATPSHINAGEAALRREFMGHRALLEDETLYGKGATELQRITNAAESEAINYSRAWDTQFGLEEAKQTKRAGVDMEGKTFDGVQTFDKVSEASHPKIRSFLDTVGDDPQAERTFALGLQRQADKIKTKADFYAMPPEMRARALRAKELTDKIVAQVRDVKSTRQMADEYAAAVSDLRDIPIYGEQLAKLKIAFGRSANLVAQSDVASSVGATAGKASARAGASSGAQSGAQSAASNAIRNGMKSEGVVVRTAQGVGKWLRKAGDTATRVGERAAYTGRRVAKAGPLLGVSVSTSNPGSAEALIRNIGALQNPQSDERRAARLSRLELRQTNPRLAQALEDHTQNVADFLAEKAGELSVGPRPGDPFGQHRKPRHSPAKIDKMARYVDAATNPAGALDRIAAGNVTREDVAVLQALYPRMYRRVRDEILQHVSTADELPSYEARLKLGILVGAPTDPSMRPAMVQALQNVARSQAGGQPDPAQSQQGPVSEPTLSPSARREPRLGKMYASQTDATSVAASRLGGS